MKTFTRGFRSFLRNPLRAALLIGLLAVSIGLSLIMLIVNDAFSTHLKHIQSTVGTDVFIHPATGMMSEEKTASLMEIPHVSKLAKKLTNTYEGENIVPAKLTEETIKILQSRGMEKKEAEELGASFDITIVGSNNPDALSIRGRRTTDLGVTIQPSKNVKIVEGRTFTLGELDSNVAVISQDLAKSNNLSIGSTLDLHGTAVTIIGMFKSEEVDIFALNAIFLPIGTAQQVFKQNDALSEATLYIDDITNVDAIIAEINSKLNTTVSVTTNTEAYKVLASPLENAQNGSKMGMIVALIASVVVILFAMFQTVRTRIKEIGILKAIGAANWNVIVQLGIEALMVGIVAAAIGALATFLLAQTIANGLIGNTAPVNEGAASLGPINVVVSPTIFFYALGLAIGLALIGSCIPSWSVARIKPAEVLRYE